MAAAARSACVPRACYSVGAPPVPLYPYKGRGRALARPSRRHAPRPARRLCAAPLLHVVRVRAPEQNTCALAGSSTRSSWSQADAACRLPSLIHVRLTGARRKSVPSAPPRRHALGTELLTWQPPRHPVSPRLHPVARAPSNRKLVRRPPPPQYPCAPPVSTPHGLFLSHRYLAKSCLLICVNADEWHHPIASSCRITTSLISAATRCLGLVFTQPRCPCPSWSAAGEKRVFPDSLSFPWCRSHIHEPSCVCAALQLQRLTMNATGHRCPDGRASRVLPSFSGSRALHPSLIFIIQPVSVTSSS
jgi:hypothetical protein